MSLEKAYRKITEVIATIANSYISVLKIILQSRFSVKLPDAGKTTCIILGNGPSLKESLLKHPAFFKQHTLVCVNHFAMSKEYAELRPSYYVMLDPVLWLRNNDPSIKKTFDAIIENTTWELTMLVPQKVKGAAFLKRITEANPNIRICHFNYTVFKGFRRFAHTFFRLNLAMPQSQNVLVASVFLCINMHFKKIILVGADHTWHQNLHVNEFNQLCVKDVHFYDGESKVDYRLFYKDATLQDTFRMDEILFTLGKAFYGYRVLKHYADEEGVCIYNASEVSFIDAFERKKLEELTTLPS